MIQLSAYARLGKDPRQIETRTGTVMAVCSAAVSIPIEQTEGETETVWLNLVCFSRVAEDLLRHRQGDLVNVFGQLSIKRWQDRQSGETRQNWQLLVEALLSARTTRPRGGRSQPPARSPRQQATESFYDDGEQPF